MTGAAELAAALQDPAVRQALASIVREELNRPQREAAEAEDELDAKVTAALEKADRKRRKSGGR